MSCKEEVEKNVSSSNGVEDEVEDEVLISLCESSDTCGDDVSSGKEKNGETISRNKYKLPELLTTIGQRAYSSSANDKRLTKEENMKDAVKPVKQDENMSATGTRQDCRDGAKVSNSYPSADEATIGIDESRTVRFKNNLFVAIEELRIQRTLDVENEEKIRTLMTEKHEEERMKEELIAKNNILIEQQTQMEIDSKKQQEDRLLQYEEDKAKHALAVECAEKELKVLKDEVRTLHLVKYKLEKKIKEQDRLIQLQNSARDSHESQISTLEKRSKKALDRCIQLAELVEKTETKVTVASRLHRKLMYTNEHQKCLLQSCRKELECKKFELVALKAALSQKKDSLSSDSDKERSSLDALERELHMQHETCRKLQSQQEDSREENKKLMQSLEEAHALLDRHVQSINKHCELEEVAHLELDETKTECRTLKKCLDNEMHKKLRLEETLQARETEWNDQKKALESRLENLQREHNSLSEAHNSLEQLNSNWSEHNMQQKTKIESMQKELDELGTRLAQDEENLQAQKGIQEELKKTHSDEISSFKARLKQVREDLESQTHRANSLQSRCSTMQERGRELENEIINKTKEKVDCKREFTDTTCQTEDRFHEQLSLLHHKLLQAEQSFITQVGRTELLENQCVVLKERVADLFQKAAQKDGKEVKTKEEISITFPTDTMSKTELHDLGSVDGSASSETSKPTETLRQVETVPDRKSLIDNSRAEGHINYGACNRDVVVLSDEANLSNAGAKSCAAVKIYQESLEGQRNISENKSQATASSIDVANEAFISKALDSSTTSTLEPSAESEGNLKNSRDGYKDDIAFLRDNEASLALRAAKAGRENESETENEQAVEDGDKIGICKESKTSADLEDKRCKEKDGQLDAAITPYKANVSAKKVRFNLEDSKPSNDQPSNVSEENSQKEPDMMFSDDEGGDNRCGNIDEDVSQRINRIQNLLRCDRLRTNRKRKYPVA